MDGETIEDKALATLLEMGMIPPKSLARRGGWIECSVDKPGNSDGRVMIFADGKGGICHNWKGGGEQRTFFLNSDEIKTRSLSKAEKRQIEKAKRQAEADRAARYAKAQKLAINFWANGNPATADHPYLKRKSVLPHGTRLHDYKAKHPSGNGTITIPGSLMIPLYNGQGFIVSLQFVYPHKNPVLGRDRNFLSGAPAGGHFWWIGKRSTDPDEPVLLCEGFATAATLHEQTGYRTYMAFSKDSLIKVARLLRERLPDTPITICADNDTDHPKGNVGVNAANEAAEEIGAAVAIPPIPNADFNDYAAYLREQNNEQ
ncbi:toprim domain-containing protein [Methylicorpusculum oleiharenae]|uniref:toprim domain-containing protein n=1 Tax=Methylicorpusculum oleiharenae TaxID=1338687 RepID=UPI001E478BEC|nr:toprim domain-containing protein [Methylicorpusculum oleiharenae]MCD2452461.1 toprim domain-containing protein [Methylicorpusculum oleiharenae]